MKAIHYAMAASPSPDATSQPSNILLRNRENQRASRARRKGYIEDLEKRVRQYERDGAGATVEVQSAARKVAEENFWLRSLLGQYGVAKNDVDDYVERNRVQALSLGQPVQSAKLLPVQRPVPRKRKHSEIELEVARTLGQIDSPQHQMSVPPWDSTQSPKVTRELRDLPTPEDSNGSEQEHTTSPELPNMHEQQYRYQPTRQACYASQETPHPGGLQQHKYEPLREPDPRPVDVTPCEEAAHIIASMRGHEDAESVWPELGCSTSKKCSVKNLTVFQLADMER